MHVDAKQNSECIDRAICINEYTERAAHILDKHDIDCVDQQAAVVRVVIDHEVAT